MSFKDYFSKQSDHYTRFRPTYPADLFSWLAQQAPQPDHAADVACGSGQAAIALADHFRQVTATDASENQIRHAHSHPRVQYAVATAESTGLPDHSVDLLTVAQAIHWFHFDNFYAEARRVLKPDGVLAVWGYGLFRIDPAVDAVVNELYAGTLDEFWPPERKWIHDHYRDLPFPFQALDAPSFSIELDWTVEHVLGYLKSWSAVVRYREKHGTDPVDAMAADLSAVWGNTPSRKVSWPIPLKVGRV